jgi:uncharacterized protein YbjQ (UPF0145 family)
MSQTLAQFLNLFVFLILLGLGYGVGRYLERRHYRSIIRREKVLNRLPAVAAKSPDAGTLLASGECQLVMGSVVVSVDYFKRVVAGLRNLVGGRVRSYESLVDRARREAVLRMKQQASERGADLVFNVKLETASISKGRKNAIGSVEVLAYGTALIPK